MIDWALMKVKSMQLIRDDSWADLMVKASSQSKYPVSYRHETHSSKCLLVMYSTWNVDMIVLFLVAKLKPVRDCRGVSR